MKYIHSKVLCCFTSRVPPLNRDVSAQAKPFDVWALGIVICVLGSYFGWVTGLQRGFGSCLVSLFLTASAYFAFVLCSCELFAALPFSGGMFGVARCTIGFFPGYLIGCSEALEYLIISSMSVSACASLFCEIFSLGKVLLLPSCIGIFLISIGSQSLGSRILWRFNSFLATSCILVITLYCLGNLSRINFTTNVIHADWFEGGVSGFLFILPSSSWFFIGVECIVFASNMMETPKSEIPKGYISCVLTLFVLGVCVLFVGCSLPPGVQELELVNPSFPLNTGFSLLFQGTWMSVHANAMSLLATFAGSHGMIFGSGKLLNALAESGLVASCFQGETAARATLYGALISFVICILTAFFPVNSVVFNVCVLSGYTTYCVHCIGYVYVRTQFSSLDRCFRSPLGIFGAVYAGSIFLLAIIAIIFFQQDRHIAVLTQVVAWCTMSLYYFYSAQKKQKFSLEEQKNLFVAHVIRHNERRRRHQRSPSSPIFLKPQRRVHFPFSANVQGTLLSKVNTRVIHVAGAGNEKS